MKEIPENVRYSKLYFKYYNLILLKKLMNIFKCSLTKALIIISKKMTKKELYRFIKDYIQDLNLYNIIKKNHKQIIFKKRNIKVFKITEEIKNKRKEKAKKHF